MSQMKRRESPVELWEDLSRELWEVQHGLGEPRLMTLDELDAAFKNEEINAHTLVRKAGTKQWRTLGDVAGLPPPSAMTLESESLMPVTSEIGAPGSKKPSTPPPLPRKSKDAIEVAAPKPSPKPVPRRSDDDIRFTESDALRLGRSPARVDAASDVIELRSSDIDVVKLDLDKERALSTLEQPAARLRELVLAHEQKETRRRGMIGKLAGVAAVALVGGAVFAGVSAWLTGTFGSPATHATHAVQAPMPTKNDDTSAAAPARDEAPPITSTEGSMLVLAKDQREGTPQTANAEPGATPAEAEPAPTPKAAAAKAAAAPLAAAPKKAGKATRAPRKPAHATRAPAPKAAHAAAKPRPAPAKASANKLAAFKGDGKKGWNAKASDGKKAKK